MTKEEVVEVLEDYLGRMSYTGPGTSKLDYIDYFIDRDFVESCLEYLDEGSK